MNVFSPSPLYRIPGSSLGQKDGPHMFSAAFKYQKEVLIIKVGFRFNALFFMRYHNHADDITRTLPAEAES